MSDRTTFHVSINNGPEQQITTCTSLYCLASAAALAMLEYEADENGEDLVKIWCPSLLPTYGPYYYRHDGYGRMCSVSGRRMTETVKITQ